MTERASLCHDTYRAALGLAWLTLSGSYPLLPLLRHEQPEVVWTAPYRRLVRWGISARTAERFTHIRGLFACEDAEKALLASGVRFVPYGAPCYPVELMHLDHPPAGLFILGADVALAQLHSVPRVTIVGTRKATPYGLKSAEAFAAAFAARGVIVVSGMALGIDARCHQASLGAGGVTVAILGCGADVAYPRRHRALYEQIVNQGVVISELPPGTQPAPWTFPRRNRLLAALGDGILVVEGSQASGALQTAGWALDLGRPVFAIPGPIAVQSYEGCNQLLYEGAGPALDPCVTVEDFFFQTRMHNAERQVVECRSSTGMTGSLAAGSRVPIIGGFSLDSMLEALDDGACSIDALVERTGLPARRVSAVMAEMEIVGLVTRAEGGLYIRAP